MKISGAMHVLAGVMTLALLTIAPAASAQTNEELLKRVQQLEEQVRLLLDAGLRLRTWLIVLPFVGVLIDIAAMWLKGFVSPIFFWLHLPGGGIFGLVFVYVSLRALWEMWIKRPQA